jgi:SNF2 family DNA or RNA helicase
VICEELEFDSHEQKFYDDLLLRGQRVVEDLKSSKGGLNKNYMCLLTMLLRLRQATDHIDLLKGKLEDDKDAVINQEPVPTQVEEEDLVDMMSGLGIEAKCTICFTMYLPPPV